MIACDYGTIMKLFEFFSVPSVEDNEKKNLTKMSDEERDQIANDIFWYILDHDDIHKKHFIPIAKKLKAELKNKNSNLEDYKECWMPIVEAGCLAFHEEHEMKGNPRKVFDSEFCRGLCERLADHYLDDIKKNKYNLGN